VTTTRTDLTTRLLALGGVIGPLIFLVACTIAGFLRPGYSPLHQAISDLGVGSLAWLLNISVVAMGVLLIGCCAAILRVLGPALGDPWRWVCSALLALPGLGFGWAAIFTEAPATVTLHWVVGMPLVAIGSIAGFLITGIHLRHLESWRSIGTYSIAASLASLALIIVMFGTWTLGIGGLTERVYFAEIMAWYVVVGWRLSNDPSRLNDYTPGTRDRPRTMSNSSAISHGESKWSKADSNR
jgi:hypothetical membrane protein